MRMERVEVLDGGRKAQRGQENGKEGQDKNSLK